MNTGQTVLTILAIVLLGINVTSTNKTYMQHGIIIQQTEIGLFGISLATSLIEEAQGKAFDRNSTLDALTDASQLTPTDSLGAEPGEEHADYNDFDDYNWMKGGSTNDNTVVKCDTIKIPDVDTFVRWSKVCYVDTTDVEKYVSHRTWNKKLTVYVKGANSPDTLQMSYVFSYWSFR